MKNDWNFTSVENHYGTERPTPNIWQFTFTDGSVETFAGHQLLQPMTSGFFNDGGPERVTVHGEIDGHWRLIYSVQAEYVREVRLLGDVNTTEFPGETRLDKTASIS